MATNQYYNKNKQTNIKKALLSIMFAVLVLLLVVLSITIHSCGAGESDTESEATSDISLIQSDVSTDASSSASDDESSQESDSETSKGDEIPAGLIGYDSTAFNCLVINAQTGMVYYSKNADDKAYPASITKLMTACVALKHCDPEEIFTAGDEVKMIGEGSSIAYILKGHRLKLSMLVDAMMLPSGNDAAYVVAVNVARRVSGDNAMSDEKAIEYFAQLMNDEAKSIGCTGTNFKNPDGYHDIEHYTTASDLAKICVYARSFEVIRESVKKDVVNVVYASGQTNTWYNTNYLLTETINGKDASTWYKPYVTGMKTGRTDQAGSCIALSAEKDGLEIIAVILNCSTITARYNEAVSVVEAVYGE